MPSQSSLEERMNQLEADFRKLNNSMHQNTCALQEFIELGKGLKFGLKMLGYIERVAVWIIKFGGAAVILWGLWKYMILQVLTQNNPK